MFDVSKYSEHVYVKKGWEYAKLTQIHIAKIIQIEAKDNYAKNDLC